MNEPTPPASSRATRWGPIALGVVLLALLVADILQTYSIRAFSDPYNWLTYARDLSRELWVSRWPVAYPAFLALMLHILGPFHVFLSNVPVLVVFLALLAAVSYRIASSTSRSDAAPWIAVTTLALLIGFRPGLFVVLANPYRDPLSHVFLLGSALCFIALLRDGTRRTGAALAAGVLLGLAASVREPAILFAAPLALAALVHVPLKPFGPVARAAAVFAAGLVIGLAPLWIHTLVTTGQMVLPPQAARAGTAFPGFDPSKTDINAARAADYYFDGIGGILAAAGAIGIGIACARLNRLLLGLALPTVVVYALFYLRYREFVERYFLIVTFWAAPIVAYGFHETLGAVTRVARLAARETRLHAALAILAVAWAGHRMIENRPDVPLFQVEQARAFTRDLEAAIPPGAFVVSPRNLCELIAFFTHAESDSATALVRDDPRSDRAVYDFCIAKIDGGQSVFFAQLTSIGDKNDDEHLLRRYFRFEPVTRVDPRAYNLQSVTGDGDVVLHRITPWEATVARFELDPPASGDVLRISLGPRRSVRGRDVNVALYVNNRLVAENVPAGVTYLPVPDDAAGETMRVVFQSDAPVVVNWPPDLLRADDELSLNFGVASRYCHDPLLSTSIQTSMTREVHARSVRGGGEIRIPTPWQDGSAFDVRWNVRGRRLEGNEPVSVRIRCGNEPWMTVEVPDRSAFQPDTIFRGRTVNAPDLTLAIEVPDPATWLDIDRVWVRPSGD